VGSLTSHNPIGLQGLLRDSFTFTLLYTPSCKSNEIRIVTNCCTLILPWYFIHCTSLHLHNSHFLTTIYLLYLTSLHFLMISSKFSLHLIYNFPNPFPKINWFTGESPQGYCRYLVPELYGPIYRGILPVICPLLSAPNFPIIIDPTHIAWPL
jgi:hypothetical protein